MTEQQKDNPGVILPPPLIYLGFLALGFGLDYLWPIAVFPPGLRYSLGGALILGGLAMAITVWRRFRDAGTNIEPFKPTHAIVTDGLFRYSRNPVYLGLSGIYAGIGMAADNVWILVLLIPALIVIRFGVIAREERYLEGKFGQDYIRYKASVRRWL